MEGDLRGNLIKSLHFKVKKAKAQKINIFGNSRLVAQTKANLHSKEKEITFIMLSVSNIHYHI